MRKNIRAARQMSSVVFKSVLMCSERNQFQSNNTLINTHSYDTCRSPVVCRKHRCFNNAFHGPNGLDSADRQTYQRFVSHHSSFSTTNFRGQWAFIMIRQLLCVLSEEINGQAVCCYGSVK